MANPVGKRAQLSPSLILGCNGHYLQDRRHYLLPFSSAASAFHSEPEAMDRWKPHFMTTCKLPASNKFYQFPLADHSCVLKPATWAHVSTKTKNVSWMFSSYTPPPPKKKKNVPCQYVFFEHLIATKLICDRASRRHAISCTLGRFCPAGKITPAETSWGIVKEEFPLKIRLMEKNPANQLIW